MKQKLKKAAKAAEISLPRPHFFFMLKEALSVKTDHFLESMLPTAHKSCGSNSIIRPKQSNSIRPGLAVPSRRKTFFRSMKVPLHENHNFCSEPARVDIDGHGGRRGCIDQ